MFSSTYHCLSISGSSPFLSKNQPGPFTSVLLSMLKLIFLRLKSVQVLSGIYSHSPQLHIFYRIHSYLQFRTSSRRDQGSDKPCSPFSHMKSTFLVIPASRGVTYSLWFYICFTYFSVNFSLINHTTLSSSQYQGISLIQLFISERLPVSVRDGHPIIPYSFFSKHPQTFILEISSASSTVHWNLYLPLF